MWPILAVQDADVVVRLAEPGGEEAAHLAAPADDEHLGPGPDAAASERVQLPDARMAEHRAEQVFDVVGVQPGLRGLGAAGGDEVLLARRVKGGEVVLLFDFGDLLDTWRRWASSSTSCLSMLSICSRSWSSSALWAGAWAGLVAEPGRGFGGCLLMAQGVAGFWDWSSGPE